MQRSPPETLTFLFTDIEGSTRLWEEHPEAMRTVLARHDAVLRDAIESQGGRVFKTVGDAFCAVFGFSVDAMNAAVDAQKRLVELTVGQVGEPLPVRVRMALHAGDAERRDCDFFGPTLNRLARLLAIAHGGQTLVSGAVKRNLLRMPDGVALLDRGSHRLKDLRESEQVFQLCHADLPAEFPPLRSLSTHPNNLPEQVTTFIGREALTTHVRELLRATRLLTLTGSGGCGKTRLALHLAAEELEGFSDGVWFVELAALSDPTLVPQSVAGVLGLAPASGTPMLTCVVEHLLGRQVLLVLDNCEHLLPACVELVDRLLRQCPGVVVVATSREALGLYGETICTVPGLAMPPNSRSIGAHELSDFEAVRLFADRSAQICGGFQVSTANAPAVAAVCRRLDGIPLAIELAAAQMRSLSVEEINSRLHQRFRLLTRGSRAALPRQQTLRSLIDWSFELLSQRERTLLSRLSVFSGGWCLEDAEQIAVGGPETASPDETLRDWEILGLHSSLVDKSLVLAEPRGGTTRYRLLETVREYAADRLAESGETEFMQQRHLAHFVGLAEMAEPHLLGEHQHEWMNRLDLDWDNLRAAFDACGSAPQGPELGLRLAGALLWYWDIRGLHFEGRSRLDRILQLPGSEARTPERAMALYVAASLASDQSDYASVQSYCSEALSIYRDASDEAGIARVLIPLGWTAEYAGDLQAAHELYQESLDIHRRLGNRRGCAVALLWSGCLASRREDWSRAEALLEESLKIEYEFRNLRGAAFTLAHLGNVAVSAGDFTKARRRFEESRAHGRQTQDRWSEMLSLSGLGHIALVEGDLSCAVQLYREALDIHRAIGRRAGIATCLVALGHIARRMEDYEIARDHFRECLTIATEVNYPALTAKALDGAALCAAAKGEWASAASLLAAGSAARVAAGLTSAQQYPEEVAACGVAARRELGEEAFSRAQSAGASLSPPALLALLSL